MYLKWKSRMMLCFLLLENAEPGAASQNSKFARSLVEELHNSTIIYSPDLFTHFAPYCGSLHYPTNMDIHYNLSVMFPCIVGGKRGEIHWTPIKGNEPREL